MVRETSRLPFPAARRWTGALWDDERGIRAFDGPHDTAEAALDWAMEMCPEGPLSEQRAYNAISVTCRNNCV